MADSLDFCHFSGIAGGGMSALAQYLRFGGKKVSGSDRGFDRDGEKDKRAYFERIGIRLSPQDGSGLTQDHTALIVSTAIEADNPEIRRARELGLSTLHRSELLAALCAAKKTVAVSGTSGKSTVSGMVFHVLEEGGLAPSLITGANLLSLQARDLLGNAAVAGGEWLVVEADESDGSLIRYHPEVAVILNIEKDHQEVDALIPLFQTFRAQSRRAVFNQDSAPAAALARPGDLAFSRNAVGDIRIRELELGEWDSRFQMEGQRFEVPVPGLHNVENALAAIAVGRSLGLSWEACAQGIQRFRGVERRFIRVGESHGITVVDDFAHNPAKVQAALETAKGRVRGLNRRVLAIFHPHGFAPMKLMGRDIMRVIAETLDDSDRVYLPDIFYAGGTADQSIGSGDLIGYLNSLRNIGFYLPGKQDVLGAVALEARSGDFVISMGARDPDLGHFAAQLMARITSSH